MQGTHGPRRSFDFCTRAIGYAEAPACVWHTPCRPRCTHCWCRDMVSWVLHRDARQLRAGRRLWNTPGNICGVCGGTACPRPGGTLAHMFGIDDARASWFDECGVADAEAYHSVDLFITPHEVLARIEAHVASMLGRIASTRSLPALTVAARTPANTARGTTGSIRLGKRRKTVGKTPDGARKIARMLKVLSFVHGMLTQGRHATQRDVYYCLIADFSSQAELNETLQECVCLLGCSRLAMNISTTSRGFAAGLLRWRDGRGAWVDCADTGTQGVAIPGFLPPTVEVEVPRGACLIVVEKDCVFQQLCGARLWLHVPCVLITGCGFPDANTRVLCYRVAQRCDPQTALGLVDYNPAGVAILLTYREGSRAMGLEMYRYAVPRLRWLGVHAADVVGLPHEALTPRDVSQRAALLASDALPTRWRGEVAAMDSKVELQAVYNSFSAHRNVAAIAERVVRRAYI